MRGRHGVVVVATDAMDATDVAQRWMGASRSRRPRSCNSAAPNDVSGFDSAPSRKRVRGVIGVRSSSSAQPNPSAHAISPFIATATDRPGRLLPATSSRANRLEASTAGAYEPPLATVGVDGTAAALGCRGGLARDQ
jgi:hypothetical protein